MARSRQRRGAVGWTARLGCMAMAGCTALQPIPPHADDFEFPAQPNADAPERCRDGAAEEPECVQPALPLDAYFGGLAQAIWNADLERRRFARLGAEKTNQANLFNAMLWPVGAYVGARNLAEPRASLLRDAGAFSLAAFGLLGSGIADRDRLYLEASRRFACAITLASPYLYAKADIGTLDAWPYATLRTLRRGQPDLATVQGNLRAVLDEFKAEQVAVRAELVTQPARRAAALTAVDKRRRQATGAGSGAAPTPPDTVAAFGRSVEKRIEKAGQALERADQINDRIVAAAGQLRGRQSSTRLRLDQALVARAPALSDPGVSAGQVVAAIGKYSQAVAAAASAASDAAANKARAQGGTTPWQLDEKTLAPLTEPSRKRLTAFEIGVGVRLQAAVDDALAWRRRFDDGIETASARAAQDGCSEALFSNASAFDAEPPAGAGSAPAGS